MNDQDWQARAMRVAERFVSFDEEHGLIDAILAFAREYEAAPRTHERDPLPTGWRAIAVDFDPPGDDPLADTVNDAWLDAMCAFDAAVPQSQRGHAEWIGRVRAAMRVLADRLPHNA